MTEIKVIVKGKKLPEYETCGASGMDIAAFVEKPVLIKPGKRALISTGLFMEIPKGFEVQIRARSGLAIKYGIGLVNGIGTIDEDYRGEIKIPLINFGEEDFTVNDGDRIAQMVAVKYEKVKLCKVDELAVTERGDGDFGHTGI